MKILLTNDDGYRSEGLAALEAALSPLHEVWILAPDGERSGQSHAITLKHPIRVKRHSDRHYSTSGTPADCVILCKHGVLPVVPDVVVSGINSGPNLGTDLIYSGTAAAARQAAMDGLPAVAVSLAVLAPPFEYGPLARFVAESLDAFVRDWNPCFFYNVNAGSVPAGGAFEQEDAEPSVRAYHDTLKVFDASDGFSYCFFTSGSIDTKSIPGSDFEIVSRGKAAVSRVLVRPSVAVSEEA